MSLPGADAGAVVAWEATAKDGTEITSLNAPTFERVNERGGARSLRIFVAGREQPIHAQCGPDESLHLFTRRAVRDALSPNAHQVNMPIVELRRGDTFVRLHVHPELGFILSSMDLNL